MKNPLAFALCLVLCATLVSTLQAQNLYQQVERRLYFSRYTEAEQLTRQALLQATAQPTSEAAAMAHFCSGMVAANLTRFQQAVDQYKMAISIWEGNDIQADTNYLRAHIWLAGSYRDLAQYDSAFVVLQKAHYIAEVCKARGMEGMHWEYLVNMGAWHAEMSQYPQAGAYYAEAVALQERLHGNRSPELAKALTQQALYLSKSLGEYYRAAELLERAERILHRARARYPLEYASVLKALAELYSHSVPRYDQVEPILERAILLVDKHLGSTHLKKAELLRVKYSYLQYSTPRFLEADELIQEARDIYTLHLGKNNIYEVALLQDLAAWYGNSFYGYFDTAVVIRRQALGICQEAFGNQHPNTAMLTLAVAKDFDAAGNQIVADSLLQKAEQMYLQIYGERHHSRIKILDERADFFLFSQDFHQADSLVKTALALRADLWGASSPKYWEGVNLAQSRYGFANRPSLADSLYQLLIPYLSIQEKGEGINYLQAKFFNRAYYYNNIKQLDSALLLSERYMDEVYKLLGRENIWYLSALQQQILLLDNPKGDIEKRRELNARFGALMQQIFGTQSMGYIQFLEYQAQYLAATRTPAEVIPYKKEIIRLKKAMGNAENTVLNLLDLARQATQNGLYALADTLLKESLDITVSSYGKQSIYYYYVCLLSADRYIELGDFDQAKYYLEEVRIPLTTSQSLYSLEELYQLFAGEYEEAIGNYAAALERLERRKELMSLQGKAPEQDPHILNRSHAALSNLGRYEEAASYLEVALPLAQEAGETNLVISLLNNLSVLKGNQGDYGAARENIQKAIQETVAVYGIEHPQMANRYNNYASLLYDMGNAQAAIDTIRLALHILQQAQGSGNAADMALYIQNMAVYYHDLGAYIMADSLYREALGMARNALGVQHPSFRYYEKNYASFLMNTGNWPAADSIFSRQLDYWERQAYRNIEYTNSLRSYADFFRQTGQYEKGLYYAQKAEAALDETMRRSLTMSYILSTQSNCYNGLGEMEKGLERLDVARGLLNNLVGNNHPDYASNLSQTGFTLTLLRRYKEAETYLDSAKVIRGNIYGVKSKQVAWTLTSLAELYAAQNRFPEAQAAITQSLAIQENYGDEYKQPYFEALLQYARIAYGQGQWVLGDSLAARVQRYYSVRARQGLGYMSYSQQIALLDQVSQQGMLPSLQAKFPQAKLSGLCYDNALLAKSSALDGGRNLRDSYLSAQDSSLRNRYDRYADLQRAIASIYEQPKEERRGLDSLERLAEQVQKQLIAESPSYQTYLRDVDTRWQDVQANLQANEAAIEYIRYRDDLGEGEGTYHYAALVLRSGSAAPDWVYLCPEPELIPLLGDERNYVKASDYAAAMTRGSIRNSPSDSAKTQYLLSWQPLDALLKGVSKVYVSPVGLLHRTPFDALPTQVGGTERLMDKYKIVLTRSTRHIGKDRSELTASQIKSALLVGDVDYGSASGGGNVARHGEPLKNLMYGRKEHDAVAAALKTNRTSLQFLTGQAATRSAFLNVLRQGAAPDLIHAIVHGYFSANATPGDTTTRDPNPMRRSGLVMAGANILPNPQDAIVLAQDISHLNLEGTELVVLSACETGLGTAAGSEGVFGLQRAFLEAGAKQAIVSLWSVDDASTSSFMQLFYQKWLGGQLSVREAFRQTQEAMRWYVDGAGNRKEADAYFWAGFILVE